VTLQKSLQQTAALSSEQLQSTFPEGYRTSIFAFSLDKRGTKHNTLAFSLLMPPQEFHKEEIIKKKEEEREEEGHLV